MPPYRLPDHPADASLASLLENIGAGYSRLAEQNNAAALNQAALKAEDERMDVPASPQDKAFAKPFIKSLLSHDPVYRNPEELDALANEIVGPMTRRHAQAIIPHAMQYITNLEAAKLRGEATAAAATTHAGATVEAATIAHPKKTLVQEAQEAAKADAAGWKAKPGEEEQPDFLMKNLTALASGRADDSKVGARAALLAQHLAAAQTKEDQRAIVLAEMNFLASPSGKEAKKAYGKEGREMLGMVLTNTGATPEKGLWERIFGKEAEKAFTR